jgi:hypothetical protein
MDSKPSKPSTLWLMLGNVGRGVLTAAVLLFFVFIGVSITENASLEIIPMLAVACVMPWLSFASYRYYKGRIAQGFTALNTGLEIAFGIFLYALSFVLSVFIYLSIIW